MIAKYNLAHKDTVQLDVKFLLSLSDKALPVLERNVDVLTKAYTQDYLYEYRGNADLRVKDQLAMRREDFLKQQKQYTWLSWNVSDAYVKEQLTANNVLSYMPQ